MFPTPVNLQALRVYIFKNAAIATLQANVTKFLQGQAVTNVETGTIAYGANEVRSKTCLGVEFHAFAGPEYQMVIYYTE